MNKVLSTLSAFAVAAVVAAPAFAEELPTNNTVAGGQGEVKVQGAGPAIGLSASALTAIGIVTVVTIAAAADSSNSTN
jgi:hypothetical protein